MESLKPSRYTVLVPLKDGRALAYNSLSQAFAVWSAAEREVYDAIGRDEPEGADAAVVQALTYGGYVVGERTDELAVLEEQYRIHRYNSRVLTLTIAPTIACNFGCDYCFQGKDKPSETMDLVVQDALVAFVERALPGLDRVGIAWYGGEPLLRTKVIEALSDRLIALCDARGVKYEAMIVTNGFKLDVETARMLHARRVKMVQITLDGDAAYHDGRRHLLGGGATFARIVTNMKAVLDAVPLGMSVRVNIDHRNRDRIRDLIDHLVAQGLAGRQSLRLYFAPVEAMTTGCHSVEEACMGKQEYGALEAELYRYAFDRGLTSLPYPPRFHGTCAAVKPSGFVVTPTGDVHKCWDTVTHPEHAVGSIFSVEDMIHGPRSQRWNTWSPFHNDSCRNCKLLPSCAGACAYKFLYSEDTRGEGATLPCPSWKYNLHERLLLRAEKQGVVKPDDYDPVAARTDPKALCTDDHIGGGRALPTAMQDAYAHAAK